MTAIWYRTFACPVCLATAFRPWPVAYCAHNPRYEIQAFDPSDPEGLQWEKMVEIPKAGLLQLLREAMS